MSVRGLFLVLILLVIAGGVALAWPRLETDPPALGAPEELVIGRKPTTIQVEAGDPGSGLRRLEVVIQPVGMPGEAKTLVQKSYPGTFWTGGRPTPRPELFELSIDPRELALPDGDTELLVRARDHSWRGGLQGNEASLRVPITIDTQPPGIQIGSGLTWVRKSGAGAAVYALLGDTAEDGIRVGDAFFRGYPHPGRPPAGGRKDLRWRAALFAIPVESEGLPEVEVVARDAAGNEAVVDFPARVRGRQFSNETIRLGQEFLDRVPPPLAEEAGLTGKTPIETFQRVNSELRQRNEQQIREIVARSGAQLPWLGGFEQMANTRVTSRFAELRSYLVGGRKVSQARHYGFDLASTSNAPVTASNAGKVLFTGELGIYGNTVILDHGLGLTTLYAHLSSISVSEGDSLQLGDELGRSGKTGLAGGDHLHFAVLVGNTYVDPVEWWDEKWVNEHIQGPLGIGS